MLEVSCSFPADGRLPIVVLTVSGNLDEATDAEVLRAAVSSVPASYRILVDLSPVTSVSDRGIHGLRSVLATVRDQYDDIALVIDRIDLRARLVLADLDRLAPILHTCEQAQSVLQTT